MHIVPYTSVSGVKFGSSESEVAAAFGPPRSRDVQPDGRIELSYDQHIFRFSTRSTLVEVTASSEYFEVVGCSLPSFKRREIAFVDLGYVVAKLDESSFECHGFFVSPKFGILFDAHHQPHLTAFSRSELGALQELAGGENAV